MLNQLLQGKLEPAMEGSARFVFNTTLGIGGLFDVATGFGLEREEEDFGQTLAVWGVEEGNYIHWPVLGPSSVRETPGLVVDALTDVLTYVAAFPAALLELVDTRANLESALRTRDEAASIPTSSPGKRTASGERSSSMMAIRRPAVPARTPAMASTSLDHPPGRGGYAARRRRAYACPEQARTRGLRPGEANGQRTEPGRHHRQRAMVRFTVESNYTNDRKDLTT